MTMADGAKVLRRCPRCRLLFEATEGSPYCIVCGDSVDGLALPLSRDDSAPIEIHDNDQTTRLPSRE
jgi:hypothetical protein